MKTTFFSCKHHDYDEYYDDETQEETCMFLCTHQAGNGSCSLVNCWEDRPIQDCKLLDIDAKEEESKERKGILTYHRQMQELQELERKMIKASRLRGKAYTQEDIDYGEAFSRVHTGWHVELELEHELRTRRY